MGIQFPENFNFPYLATSPRDFWKRWHISLSTWFRDYLYIPLGGSKGTKWLTVRNIFITFIASGLWHGANWQFLTWGAAHALLYTIYFLLKKNLSQPKIIISKDNLFPTPKEFFQILSTYFSITIVWVFFRGESIMESLVYLYNMFYNFSFPSTNLGGFLLIFPFVCFEWLFRHDQKLIYFIDGRFKYSKYNLNRICYYLILFFLIAKLLSNESETTDFIYFQF